MFLEIISSIGFLGDDQLSKMMPYPEFHGSLDEDVVSFLENLELTCISNHIVDDE